MPVTGADVKYVTGLLLQRYRSARIHMLLASLLQGRKHVDSCRLVTGVRSLQESTQPLRCKSVADQVHEMVRPVTGTVLTPGFVCNMPDTGLSFLYGKLPFLLPLT